MTPIQILEEILALLPGGIQITAEILALIQAISDAFGTASNVQQKAVITALAAHLKKA
jgi:hypothetical protein